MKEVEVKAKVMDGNDLIQRLKEKGCTLSDPVEQYDQLFLPNDMTYMDLIRGPKDPGVLRIRTEQDLTLLTFKKKLSNELDKLEHELIINDGQEMTHIFTLLGYHKALEFRKSRRKGQCNGYEICLDEVDDLGTFIEIEKITDDDSAKTQEELFGFLVDCGIGKENRITEGYDTMICKKHNLE